MTDTEKKVVEIKEAIAWLTPFDDDTGLTSEHIRAISELKLTATNAVKLLEMEIPITQQYDDFENGCETGKINMLNKVKAMLIGGKE